MCQVQPNIIPDLSHPKSASVPRGNSLHPKKFTKKLPLQVFALFSFSLVPLSKHCSRSHLHMPWQGALLLHAPFSLYLVLSFLQIRFLCKAQILIYRDLAAVSTISVLHHWFSCQHSKNHLYERGKCFIMVVKGNTTAFRKLFQAQVFEILNKLKQ